MPVGKYLALTALGSLAWNAILIAIGQQLGSRWTEVEGAVAPIATLLAVVGILAAGIFYLRWRLRAAQSAAAG